jgi:cobalt-zinc-cadmium resistance protein CzcA
VGYTITYGGQFENLQNAKSRLLIAVPVALILIFLMLYFAFNSIKEALLIFSAIPLSAVGGILFLWFRDMPFSISAGVGFIALFGIAVLNGIVLIEHFKELKHQGFDDMETLIKQGTKDRLRAVLLTAAAAALGFLPMAISTNAGAEVQRPLATVVIGGLVTATLLTMIVLPVLYSYFTDNQSKKIKLRKNKPIGVVIILFLFSTLSFGQQKSVILDELIAKAIENNSGLKANKLKVEQSDVLISTAFDFDKTEVYYSYDENNLAFNNKALDVFGIQQSFKFPTVYFAGKKLNSASYDLEVSNYAILEKALKRKVTSGYYQYLYAKEKEQLISSLDSLYENFAAIATRRFELGETNYLEKITAQSKQKQIKLNLSQAQQELKVAYAQLKAIVQSEGTLAVASEPLTKISLEIMNLSMSPEMEYYKNKISLFEAQRNYQKQELLPDFSLNYFQGTNSGINSNLIGYQLGLKIPLLFNAQSSRIKSSSIAVDIVQEESQNFEINFNTKYQELQLELEQYEKALAYFEQEGEAMANEILKTANSSFKNGEIDFYQYILSVENAYDIQINHLEHLNNYNQTIITINYLTL